MQDVRALTQALTTTRAALKQADVRIAILEERILSLQQVQHRGFGGGREYWGWGGGLCSAVPRGGGGASRMWD